MANSKWPMAKTLTLYILPLPSSSLKGEDMIHSSIYSATNVMKEFGPQAKPEIQLIRPVHDMSLYMPYLAENQKLQRQNANILIYENNDLLATKDNSPFMQRYFVFDKTNGLPNYGCEVIVGKIATVSTWDYHVIFDKDLMEEPIFLSTHTVIDNLKKSRTITRTELQLEDSLIYSGIGPTEFLNKTFPYNEEREGLISSVAEQINRLPGEHIIYRK
jgi:hypothetical protein